jgi:PAS domain-containing protein
LPLSTPAARSTSGSASPPSWETTTPSEAELRVAQRETKHALEFLKSLQADAPVGLSIVDREFRYVRINENLAATNATTVEAHIGRSVADVLPELWRRIEPYYLRVLATGQALANLEVESSSVTPPGEVRRWRESYYPVAAHGEIIGVGAIVTAES